MFLWFDQLAMVLFSVVAIVGMSGGLIPKTPCVSNASAQQSVDPTKTRVGQNYQVRHSPFLRVTQTVRPLPRKGNSYVIRNNSRKFDLAVDCTVVCNSSPVCPGGRFCGVGFFKRRHPPCTRPGMARRKKPR